MKKVVIIAAAALGLAGCLKVEFAEEQDWTATRAYVKTGDNWTEVEVEAVERDGRGGGMVAVETKSEVFVTHGSNVVLVKDKFRRR